MSSFVLKIIACISMFIDHLRYILPNQPFFMAYIGRLAFPIFAFQVTEGYSRTKNLKKYLFRLFIFAIISQIPYKLLFPNTHLNVIFTLFLGLICLIIYDYFIKNNSKTTITTKLPAYLLGCSLIITIIYLSEIINVDYGFYGVALILIFYIFKDKKIITTVLFIILTLLFFCLKYKYFWLDTRFIILFICTLLGIVPCLLYNGKQGPKVKYIIYIFYPLHLLVLFLLNSLMLTYL